MKRHLSPEWEDEVAFKKEMLEKLPKEQAEAIFAAAHRPNRALQDLSSSIENLPMHFMRRDEIHSAATIFEDNLGSSERLLTSPIPVFYSRHTARFLSVWLIFLPFGLWGPLGNSWNHIGLLPVTAMLSMFLFGIEELATQLEEPFTILPMQGFCDKIYNWCTEIVTFKPGDNGMPVYYYDNYSIEMSEGIAGTAANAAIAAAAAAPNGIVPIDSEIVAEVPSPSLQAKEHVAEVSAHSLFDENSILETANMAAEPVHVNGDAEVEGAPVATRKRYAVKRAIGRFFGE
jgi:hypothetical protein